MKRLDRAFASVDWVNSYSFYALKNLSILRSYHGPLFLTWKCNRHLEDRSSLK